MAIEKMAQEQFKKLSKKEQKAINALRRVPTCRGTSIHGHSKYCKKDRKWSDCDYAGAPFPSF